MDNNLMEKDDFDNLGFRKKEATPIKTKASSTDKGGST
jgi:hypothetical protein